MDKRCSWLAIDHCHYFKAHLETTPKNEKVSAMTDDNHLFLYIRVHESTLLYIQIELFTVQTSLNDHCSNGSGEGVLPLQFSVRHIIMIQYVVDKRPTQGVPVARCSRKEQQLQILIVHKHSWKSNVS